MRFSPPQISTLRFISNHIVRLDTLRIFRQNTLWSLFHNDLIFYDREKDQVMVTKLGLKVLGLYGSGDAAKRITPDRISNGVSRLLRTHRKNVIEFRKIA